MPVIPGMPIRVPDYGAIDLVFEGVSLLNTRVFAIDDLVFRMYVGINSDECNKDDDWSSLIYTSLSAAGYKMEAVLHLKPQTSITSIIIPDCS